MKTLLCLLLVLAAAGPVSAQRYILKDGRALNQSDVTVRDGKLVRTIGGAGGGAAEVSFTFSQIARLDWPEPAELAEARKLIDTGKPAEAADLIEPVYRQFAAFPKLPGSWWDEAALVRARAFAAQNKTEDAERAARELVSTATDADKVSFAQILIAEIQIRIGKPDMADVMLDEIARKRTSSEAEARAALLRGDIAFAKKDFEAALQYYLQVPAFYGTMERLMPQALLGSARSYRGYGDTARSERAYIDVMNDYPDSAQAAAAKRESGL